MDRHGIFGQTGKIGSILVRKYPPRREAVPPAGVLPCPKRIIFDKKTGLLHGKARITLDKLSEDGVLLKYGGAACHEQLPAGTGHGNVKLAVDGTSVLIEAVGTEEVELIGVADGERIDDDIALRTLIAFDGVDADIKKLGDS